MIMRPKSTRKPLGIYQAMTDPNWFAHVTANDPKSWRSWLIVAKALDGIRLTGSDKRFWKKITGLDYVPTDIRELWMVMGRRSGKSQFLAICACVYATRDWTPWLSPGEVATIMLLAQDLSAARSSFRYALGMMEGSPNGSRLISSVTASAIRLTNRSVIETLPSSFRTRGYSCPALFADEVSMWRNEFSVNPAEEVLAALRPSMAQFPGRLLIAAGSAYTRSGPLYDTWEAAFGKPDAGTLVLWAATRTMNRTISKEFIAGEIKRDPLRNSAEYSSQWRDATEAFMPREAVLAVQYDAPFRQRVEGANYVFFCDASGGRNDAFAGAAARMDPDGNVHVDFAHAIPAPFSPDEAIAEFAEYAASYGCREIYADDYGAQFQHEAFARHGVTLNKAKATASELLLSLGPRVNSGTVSLPANRQLFKELIELERRPGGIMARERVGHGRGKHDDLAVAVAGAVFHASRLGRFDDVDYPISPDSVIVVPLDEGSFYYD